MIHLKEKDEDTFIDNVKYSIQREFPNIGSMGQFNLISVSTKQVYENNMAKIIKELDSIIIKTNENSCRNFQSQIRSQVNMMRLLTTCERVHKLEHFKSLKELSNELNNKFSEFCTHKLKEFTKEYCKVLELEENNIRHRMIEEIAYARQKEEKKKTQESPEDLLRRVIYIKTGNFISQFKADMAKQYNSLMDNLMGDFTTLIELKQLIEDIQVEEAAKERRLMIGLAVGTLPITLPLGLALGVLSLLAFPVVYYFMFKNLANPNPRQNVGILSIVRRNGQNTYESALKDIGTPDFRENFANTLGQTIITESTENVTELKKAINKKITQQKKILNGIQLSRNKPKGYIISLVEYLTEVYKHISITNTMLKLLNFTMDKEKKLGSGASGSVYLGKLIMNNNIQTEVAIKQIPKDHPLHDYLSFELFMLR